MAKTVTFSTIIDMDIKKALNLYCKKKGLKIQSFIEKAILEQLEDEIDLEAYYARKNEDEVPLESILKKTA